MNLDEEYNNRARVPEFEDVLARWETDAAAYRSGEHVTTNIAYGDNERQKMDLVAARAPKRGGENSPIVIFIHGGYWQMLGREFFVHLAEGAAQNGFDVIVPSYHLCPEASLADIITDIQLLCAHAWRKWQRKLVVTGHSAGGHLAAAMAATDWTALNLPSDIIKSGLSISGLFDLRPLIATRYNEALQLDDESARASSPLLWKTPSNTRFRALVGGDESSEFIRQSKTLAAAWKGSGLDAEAELVPNKNHFTVIDELADPDSSMSRLIVDLAGF